MGKPGFLHPLEVYGQVSQLWGQRGLQAIHSCPSCSRPLLSQDHAEGQRLKGGGLGPQIPHLLHSSLQGSG